MNYNEAMASRELRLPGLGEPPQNAAASLLQPNEAEAPHGIRTLRLAEEHRWMRTHFPDTVRSMPRIFEVSRIEPTHFAVQEDSPEALDMDDAELFARCVTDVATTLGSNFRSHLLAKNMVYSKASGAQSRRLRQSVGAIIYPGLVGQFGEYSVLSIMEYSDSQRRKNVIPLTDGFLASLAGTEPGAATGETVSGVSFSIPDTPLGQDTVVTNLAQSQSSGITNALLRWQFIAHDAPDLEAQAYELLKLHRDQYRAEHELALRESTREFFKQLGRFGSFLTDIETAVFDPKHPKHEAIIGIFDKYLDTTVTDELMQQIGGCYNLLNPPICIVHYRQAKELMSRDEPSSRVYGRIRSAIESNAKMKNYDLDPDDPEEVMNDRSDIFLSSNDASRQSDSYFMKEIIRLVGTSERNPDELTEFTIMLSDPPDDGDDDRDEGAEELTIKIVGRDICFANFDLSPVDGGKDRRTVRAIFPLYSTEISKVIVNGIDNTKNNAIKSQLLIAVHTWLVRHYQIIPSEEIQKNDVAPGPSRTKKPVSRPNSEVGDVRREMLRERRREKSKPESSTLASGFPEPKELQMAQWPAIDNAAEMFATIESEIRRPEDRQLVYDKIRHYQDHGLGLRDVTITKTSNRLVRIRAGRHRILFSKVDGVLTFKSIQRREDSKYW